MISLSPNRRNVVYYFAPRQAPRRSIIRALGQRFRRSPLCCCRCRFLRACRLEGYLPVRRKRLLKIAVFGLVGEAPNYWRSGNIVGEYVNEPMRSLYWRNTLNTNGYYFEPRRGALLEINRYLPNCLYLRLARRCGVKTGNSWRDRF